MLKFNVSFFLVLKEFYFHETNGSENLWYGKPTKGELEFFTYYSLHSVIGKTLDPITQYLIDIYLLRVNWLKFLLIMLYC